MLAVGQSRKLYVGLGRIVGAQGAEQAEPGKNAKHQESGDKTCRHGRSSIEPPGPVDRKRARTSLVPAGRAALPRDIRHIEQAMTLKPSQGT